MDGHRIKIIGRRALTTEGYDLAPDFKHWGWWTAYQKRPPHSILHCELHVPGQKSSYVKTALKLRDPALRLTCFAVEDPDLESLDLAEDWCGLYGIPWAPHRRLSKNWSTEELLRWAEKAGDEGWVLKGGNYRDWFKLKPIKTIDLVVTGFKDGNGKFLGLVGALRCSVVNEHGKMIEVACCSGMDDNTRLDITKSDLGRIVEVKYQYVTSKGRLRHPRFKCWRDDKTSARCGTGQDPDLQEYWNGRAN